MSLQWKLTGGSDDSPAFRCVPAVSFGGLSLECKMLKTWVVRVKLREKFASAVARAGNLNFGKASTGIASLRMWWRSP